MTAQYNPDTGYYIPRQSEPIPNSMLDEFLTLDQLSKIPPPAPLITGTLNLNSLAWIAGPPGSYKTFLAIEYALTVAQHSPMLYVAGEGLSGLNDRVQAWIHANGRVPQYTRWLPRAVPATSTTDWVALCDAAQTIGAKLIVLDTQARMSGALDENDARDMGRYIDSCEALKRATGACVLNIHHSAKNGSHLRGSTAVQGAADTVITIEARDGTIGVHNLKQKDIKQFPDRWYRPTQVLTSCVLTECEKPMDWDAPKAKYAYGKAKD